MGNPQYSYTKIPINNKLLDLGVTRFVRQSDLIQIIFYKHKVVSFNLRKQLQQTLDRFTESAVNDTVGLSKEIVSKVERVLVHPDNGYIPYLQLNNYNNGSGEQENEAEFDTEKLNQTYATVYDDKTSLYEVVIIDSVPFFAKISVGTDKISLCEHIQLSHGREVLFSLPSILYMSRPYVFRSEREFYAIVEKVRHETLDSLYNKVKAKWNLYIDHGKEHNIMCAADTVGTHFQDKLGVTHYDFFVGDNGTGKTNNLHLFKCHKS